MSRIGTIGSATLAALVLLAGTALAGPYADGLHGIKYNDPRFVGWATGASVSWPAGFTPFYNNPALATGAAPGTSNDVVTLGDCGTAVLTFGQKVRNLPGPDLAVFENGFNDPLYPGKMFAELAFVEVSTDGTSYARFPSVSLNPWPGEYGSLDPTNVYNLAGKSVNNNGQAWQGTPFDLSDLVNDPLVKTGAVNLANINYVRIVDIYGHSDGSTWDTAASLIDPTTGLNYTTNHKIYDGGNFGGNLAGFDLDAVGILAPLPGDANGDGKVDGTDLAIWQQNYDPLGLNAATNSFGTADFNGDGKVDGTDLAIWQQHYSALGLSPLANEAVQFSAVPEPASLMLVLAGLPGLAVRLRRRGA